MRNNRKIIIKEIAIFLIVASIIFILQNIQDIEALSNEVKIQNFLQSCFDLNLAIAIASLVALMIEKKVQVKGRQLKRITCNSLLIIFFNSLIMASHNLFGIYGLPIVAATLYGNVIKIWDLSKYILCII